MFNYYGRKHVSVANKRKKAEKKLKKLKKENPKVKPIIIANPRARKLAKTWWGNAWNQNLEKYADYDNRIGRGKSYVRHGAILDLQIKKGKVTALVAGSRSTPYKVTIEIDKIPLTNLEEIKNTCKNRIDSLQDLLAGNFPQELSDLFTSQFTGLFPLSKEIHFDCSCPDWASMCKHVAATLYGIGVRFDEDPKLFFKLRQVDIKSLIKQAVKTKTKKLLDKAKKKSSRTIKQENLSELFDIDLD